MSAKLAESSSMNNPHKGRTGIDRILHATRHSADGLRTAYRFESAFRQEFWLAVFMLPGSLWLGQSWPERTLLAGTVTLVLIVELLNSGIVAAVDPVSLDLHDLSKRAKDYGSAAVMLSLLLCGGAWLSAIFARLSS